MARRAAIALALARSAALQAAPRPRPAATRAGAAPSLFDAPATDDLETLEALEEALEAKAALYRGDSRTKSPAWDAAFWREFDGEAQCRAVESADAAAGARLRHFLTLHRVLSLSANQRNRTEFVSRYAASALAEDGDGRRVVSALHAYPGLETQPKLELPPWAASFGQTVAGLAGSELAAIPEEAASEETSDENKFLDLDSKAEDEFGEGIMEEFGELESEPLKMSTQDAGAPEDLAASLEALDAAYRDGEEEALDFSDELAELLDDGGAEEDAAEPVAERKAATAHAYGRATALGRSHFPAAARRARRRPGPRPAPRRFVGAGARHAHRAALDLQAYTATLYVLVAGSGGVVVDGVETTLAPGEALLLDTTFRHATFAGAGGARFVAVDVAPGADGGGARRARGLLRARRAVRPAPRPERGGRRGAAADGPGAGPACGGGGQGRHQQHGAHSSRNSLSSFMSASSSSARVLLLLLLGPIARERRGRVL